MDEINVESVPSVVVAVCGIDIRRLDVAEVVEQRDGEV